MDKKASRNRAGGSAPSLKNNRGINNPSKKRKHSQSLERILKKHVTHLELTNEKLSNEMYIVTKTTGANAVTGFHKSKNAKKRQEDNNSSKLKATGSKEKVLKEKKKKFEPLTESLLDEGFEYHQSSDSDHFSDLSSFFKDESLIQEDCEISYGPLMRSSKLLPEALKKKKNAPKQLNIPTPLENQDLPCAETSVESANLLELLPEAEPVEPIKFYTIPNSDNFLLQMKHPASLFFQGQLNAKVVVGSMEVLGCTLTSNTKRTTILSPGGSSLLSLQTVEQNTTVKQVQVSSALVLLGMSSEQVQHITANLDTEGDCLVVISKACTDFSSYLSHCSIYLYPRANDPGRKYFKEENILHCQFETHKEKISKCYMKPQPWDDLVKEIVEEAQMKNPLRVMVCGGKSVGKSTLLRFMVNKCLSHFEEILFLDFDPGQAEFSVPGCVSVVRVNGPLLGPNFTHLLQQERTIYVGDVDISKCPDRYIKSVHNIIDYCHLQPEFKQMVWFVNTMGYSKGLGVELTTSLIRMVDPSRLVQIQSHSAKRNYPDLLTPNNVLSHPSRWHEAYVASDARPSYKFLALDSAAEKKQHGMPADWGLQPKTARDIVVLSYINQMLQRPRFSLTDVIPFKTSIARLVLSVCNESVHYSQFLSVINGNLVALCTIDEANDDVLYPSDPAMPRVLVQPPVAPCLGFGVVRGVDLLEGVIYLISPLSQQQMSAVNCLVKGTVMLPACVYTDSNRGLGHVPYVAVGPGQATSKGIARRFFHPLKN